MKNQLDSNYPQVVVGIVNQIGFQVSVIILTLVLVTYYNLSYYLYTPVTGVWLGYADDSYISIVIDLINPGGPGEQAGLQLEDKILTVDGREITNLNIPIYEPLKNSGNTVVYVVERAGQKLTFPVVVGSYLEYPQEYLLNIIPGQLLSFIVYLLGLVLFLFSPVRDIRARLIGVTWLLAGVVLAATGSGYISCAWFAGEVAIIAFAISNFFSLGAHLHFPISTFSTRHRGIILSVVLGASCVMSVLYLIQRISLPPSMLPHVSLSAVIIRNSFSLIWLANIGLLIKNRFLIRDKETRRQTNIVFMGTLVGFMPFLLLTGLPRILGPEYVLVSNDITTLFLIFIPISYGYVIYQRRLLKIDLILNRSLVFLLLIFLILFSSMTIFQILSILLKLPSQVALLGGVLCVLVALPSAFLQQRIQIQVDRVLYGGYYDFTTVTTKFSDRLSQTTSREEFIKILTVDLPQHMQIEKSALLMVRDDLIELQAPKDAFFSIHLVDDEILKILVSTPSPCRTLNLWPLVNAKTAEQWSGLDWAQVLMPISQGGALYGVLALGERSTGNIYSNQDMQILATIGQQAGMSIANISLVESLRGLAQQLVRSDEEQRRVLARDLHDDILQNLFFIHMQLAEKHPELAVHLNETIKKLRQTIKAQRPSLLDRGIVLALEDLIKDLHRLAAGKTILKFNNLLAEPITLDDERTTSLFRIVQEALSNILKHADADEAIVTIKKDRNNLEVQVKDNGIGFLASSKELTQGHFGLLGMKERAVMIGATLTITSEVEKGTIIIIRMVL